MRCASFQIPVSRALKEGSKAQGKAGLIEELPAHVRAWDSGMARYNGHMATYHAQSARRCDFRAAVQAAAAASAGSQAAVRQMERREEKWREEGWQRVEVPRLDYFSFQPH